MREVILQMGKRGTVVIPAKLRKRLKLEDGCFLALSESTDSLHLRKVSFGQPTTVDKRSQAATILSNASNLGEYLAAIEEVRQLGFDPEEIPHERFEA